MMTMSHSIACRSCLFLICATLFLALSAFECASTEMTTAKVAINARDYAKAEDALRREVAARPQNSEAWVLLAKIYEDQFRFADLNEAFKRAESATQPPITAEQREAILLKRYNHWSVLYNGAARAHAARDFPMALRRLDTAVMIRESAHENLYLKGLILAASGDTVGQSKSYLEYARRVRPDVDKGVAAGIALGMSVEDVTAKLGAATEGEVSDSTGGWGYFASRNLAVFYAPNAAGRITLNGWRAIGPAEIPISRRIPSSIQSDVFYTLGVDAYFEGEKNKARYDDALSYFTLVEKLDPSYDQAGKIIAQIYISTGRTAEARKRYEQEMRDSPNDATLAINYGNFLINLEEFQGAIAQYEQAARVAEGKDAERHHQALFNLGAAFKNWGAKLQDSIRKAAGAKPPTKAQEEIYLVKLRESVKRFEDLKKIKGSTSDFGLLFELANLYQVLGENAKMKTLLKSLEELSTTQGESSTYWEAMGRLYANIGDGSKADAAFVKADALKKQGK